MPGVATFRMKPVGQTPVDQKYVEPSPVRQWLAQRWRSLLNPKLGWLMALATILSAFCMMGLVLGSALFLNHVGTSGLPWVYMSLGLVSLPLYLGLAQVVDRVPRPRLMRWSLSGAIALVSLGWSLLTLQPDAAWVYGAVDVGLYSVWILVLEVLFPSFVTDYFTALDWQRCSTAIRMAIAVGGLGGGAIVALLARWWSSQQLLWLLVGMAVVAIALVQNIDRRLDPLPSPETTTNAAPLSGPAIADYPIIPLLALGTLFTIVLYCIAEYLYFNVYTTAFADSTTLTQFLGTMRMVNNIIPLLVLYGITQPLLQKFGVVRMNWAYPLLTLGIFTGFGLAPTLGLAIALNINNNGFEDSLNQPIAILNYNAVPYSWVGRVRALCHGLMYSLGLMLAGGALVLLQAQLTRGQIVGFGLGVSMGFVGLRYAMGQSYLRSLLQLLRAQRVAWEQVRPSLPQLPMQYRLEVDELLTSRDRDDQLLGVTLAARLRQPQSCLPDLFTLIDHAPTDSPLARRLGRFCWEHPHPTVVTYLGQQLPTATPRQQQLVLEALVRRRVKVPRPLLTELLSSANPTVRGLAYLAAERSKLGAFEDSTLCEALPLTSRLTVLRVIRATGDRRLIPLVQRLIEDQAVEVLRAGLDTLAVLVNPGERRVAALAQRELSTFDPLIQALNMQLLGRLRHPQFLADVAEGLEHRHLSVRLWSALALAQYGNISLRFAQTYLKASRPEVVSAAIAALGRVGSAQASDLLYRFLTPDYQRLKQLQTWRQTLPQAHPDEARLHHLLSDAQDRIVERVWSVLKALEDNSHLLQELEPFLTATDDRLRASAIERLASGRWRRFVLPLLPCFTPQPVSTHVGSATEMIHQLWRSDDRWLRLGSLLWLSNHGKLIPAPLCVDSDPLVRRVAESLRSGAQEDLPENDWFLKQLFFIKESTPLGILSLDELEIINPLLNQYDFRQGEILCSPEHTHARLYIMYQGHVQLQPLDLSLTVGDIFGVATLWNPKSWPQTVTAQTDGVILMLSQPRIQDVIDRCPRILWCLTQLRDRSHPAQALPVE